MSMIMTMSNSIYWRRLSHAALDDVTHTCCESNSILRTPNVRQWLIPDLGMSILYMDVIWGIAVFGHLKLQQSVSHMLCEGKYHEWNDEKKSIFVLLHIRLSDLFLIKCEFKIEQKNQWAALSSSDSLASGWFRNTCRMEKGIQWSCDHQQCPPLDSFYLGQAIVDDIVQRICGWVRIARFMGISVIGFRQSISWRTEHVDHILWNAIIVPFTRLNATIWAEVAKFGVVFVITLFDLFRFNNFHWISCTRKERKMTILPHRRRRSAQSIRTPTGLTIFRWTERYRVNTHGLWYPGQHQIYLKWKIVIKENSLRAWRRVCGLCPPVGLLTIE